MYHEKSPHNYEDKYTGDPSGKSTVEVSDIYLDSLELIKNSKFVIPSFFKETFRSAMGHGNYELRLADSDSSQNDREYMDDEVVKHCYKGFNTSILEWENYVYFFQRQVVQKDRFEDGDEDSCL